MICPKCGFDVADGSKFCPKCGADLQGVPGGQPAGPVEQPQGPVQMNPNVVPNQLPQNSMGIAAFVCGLLGALCCTFLGIPGVICGIIGLNNAKQGKVSNKDLWMCYAGIVLGAIGILMLVLNIIGVGPSSWFNN